MSNANNPETTGFQEQAIKHSTEATNTEETKALITIKTKEHQEEHQEKTRTTETLEISHNFN